MTVIGINVVGEHDNFFYSYNSNLKPVAIMMFLRINALYPRQKWVTNFVLLLLIVQVSMNCWLLTRGERRCSSSFHTSGHYNNSYVYPDSSCGS